MSSGYMTEAQRKEAMAKPRLVVRAVEARGIKAADFGGTSDPFLEIRIKGQPTSVKTKVIKKTLNPFWNEEFILYPTNVDTDVLSVKLYDFDTTSNNDLLGEMEYNLASLVNKPAKEEWRPVTIKKGPNQFAPGKGEVKLGFALAQAGQPLPLFADQVPQQQQQPQTQQVQQPYQQYPQQPQPQAVYGTPYQPYPQPQVVYATPQPQVVYATPQPQVVYATPYPPQPQVVYAVPPQGTYPPQYPYPPPPA